MLKQGKCCHFFHLSCSWLLLLLPVVVVSSKQDSAELFISPAKPLMKLCEVVVAIMRNITRVLLFVASWCSRSIECTWRHSWHVHILCEGFFIALPQPSESASSSAKSCGFTIKECSSSRRMPLKEILDEFVHLNPRRRMQHPTGADYAAEMASNAYPRPSSKLGGKDLPYLL